MDSRTTEAASPRAGYAERLERHQAAEAHARQRSVRLSNFRAGAFLATAAALLGYDVLEGPSESIALVIAAGLSGIFVILVVAHRRVRREGRWHGALALVAREGVHRLDRDWGALSEALPANERLEPEVDPEHPFAADLDVVGTASLVRLLGPVTSERGRAMLHEWLLEPGGPDTARARQGAARELATLPELRAEYTALGRLEASGEGGGLAGFLTWAEGDPWILDRRGLRFVAVAFPVVLLAALAADVFFGLPPWWLVPALAQLAVLRKLKSGAGRSFVLAAGGQSPLTALVPQLTLLEGRSWSDPLLGDLGERLGAGDAAAHVHLARLRRLLDTVESRGNMIYVALAPVLLLDAHVGVALDRWRRDHGRAVRDWIAALGEWEALSGLGTLAHDHPDWTFPRFASSGTPLLEAKELGHPLLEESACVRYDLTVGPSGSFLLVTGSNMSGKSTLLRAIGANAVLAAAGAPVCAASLILPPLRVHTSMRVDDSLAAGVSLFMAELLRVRGIVDAANATGPDLPPLLYLLDEIMHGTNTAERRVAARAVVRHLLSSGAIGAVSTHDLTLAATPDLRAAAHTVHLRERVEHPQGPEGPVRLSFDYKLHPGLATTRNALELMRAVGLGDLRLDPDEE